MKLESLEFKGVSMAPQFNKSGTGFVVLEAEYFIGSYVLANLDDNQPHLNDSLLKTATNF